MTACNTLHPVSLFSRIFGDVFIVYLDKLFEDAESTHMVIVPIRLLVMPVKIPSRNGRISGSLIWEADIA